jgi:anti-sigma-K factor RskA
MTEEEDIDGLAAEYVLGSLDAAERAQVDDRSRSDASLRLAIEHWQRRLAPLSEQTPLSEQLPNVAPPPGLFDSILSRISETAATPTSSAEVIPLHRSHGRGRRLAIGATALAACLVFAVGVWLIYAGTSPPPTRVAAMDCGGLYKDFWGKLDPEKYARLPAEQLAGVSRMALRAYDACQAGDALDAEALFGRLRRMRF